ncbi:unnamed protein product [Pylaiella littoralis]
MPTTGGSTWYNKTVPEKTPNSPVNSEENTQQPGVTPAGIPTGRGSCVGSDGNVSPLALYSTLGKPVLLLL